MNSTRAARPRTAIITPTTMPTTWPVLRPLFCDFSFALSFAETLAVVDCVGATVTVLTVPPAVTVCTRDVGSSVVVEVDSSSVEVEVSSSDSVVELSGSSVEEDSEEDSDVGSTVTVFVVFDDEDEGPCVPEGRTLPRDT